MAGDEGEVGRGRFGGTIASQKRFTGAVKKCSYQFDRHVDICMHRKISLKRAETGRTRVAPASVAGFESQAEACPRRLQDIDSPAKADSRLTQSA